jgi:hypothetical protein
MMLDASLRSVEHWKYGRRLARLNNCAKYLKAMSFGRRGYSLGLLIQDRQACYCDHTG